MAPEELLLVFVMQVLNYQQPSYVVNELVFFDWVEFHGVTVLAIISY